MLGIRVHLLWVWVLLFATSVRSASADENADLAEAKRLKNLGTASLAAGDYAQALEQFRSAYRALPSPNLKFNIGLVLAKQGRKIEAADEFRGFLSGSTNAPADARTYAKASLSDLERELGQIDVVANTDGAEVFVDDRSAGKTPFAASIYVWPGTHRIRAHLAGHGPFNAELLVDAGTRREIAIVLVPSTPISRVEVTPPPPVIPAASRRVKIASVVLGGAGVAALAVGAGLLGHYGGAYGSASDSFDQFASAHRLEGERIGGSVMMAAGGALLASGVILYLVKRHQARRAGAR